VFKEMISSFLLSLLKVRVGVVAFLERVLSSCSCFPHLDSLFSSSKANAEDIVLRSLAMKHTNAWRKHVAEISGVSSSPTSKQADHHHHKKLLLDVLLPATTAK
jgi:hypothetical protein